MKGHSAANVSGVDRASGRGGRKVHRSEREAERSAADLLEPSFQRKLESLALLSRRAQSQGRLGERRSRKRGGGLEFVDHRPYVSGDDVRALDFHALRRHGRLFIREFEEQEDLSLYLALDCSASMATRGGVKFALAKQIAAALGYIGLTGLERVGVHALRPDEFERLAPLRGRNQVFRLLRFLSALEARGGTDLIRSLGSFVRREKRRGVVVLITDGYDAMGLEASLRLLLASGFEPRLIELVDDADLSLTRGEVLLVDAETGEERSLTITDEKVREWGQLVAARRTRLVRLARSRGIPAFPVDVSWSLDTIVLTLLRRGGLVT